MELGRPPNVEANNDTTKQVLERHSHDRRRKAGDNQEKVLVHNVTITWSKENLEYIKENSKKPLQSLLEALCSHET